MASFPFFLGVPSATPAANSQPNNTPSVTTAIDHSHQQHHQPPASRRKWDAEKIVRSISNVIIIGGTITCLGVAVAAVSEVDSESTVIFLLLVPAFFGGGCLLTLVNVSWMSRRPGKRCSVVQLICNMVLALMTTYVELLFWPYHKQLAVAILCGATVPMFVFINMPSIFVQVVTNSGHHNHHHRHGTNEGDMNTVVMEDDEHSLFHCEMQMMEDSTTQILPQQFRTNIDDLANDHEESSLEPTAILIEAAGEGAATTTIDNPLQDQQI